MFRFFSFRALWGSVLVPLFILSGCNKEAVTASDNHYGRYRIAEVSIDYAQGHHYVLKFEYDDQNRAAEWTYTANGLSMRQEYSVVFLQYELLLNPNTGLVETAYTTRSNSYPEKFRRKYSFDSKKRLIKIVSESYDGFIYVTGETREFYWNNQNEITQIHVKYFDDNTGELRYTEVKEVSGYSKDYPNTLKAVNYGLDVFGPYGGVGTWLGYGETGGIRMENDEIFIGDYLPANYGDFSYVYEKDKLNRITKIVTKENGTPYKTAYISYK